MPTLKATLAHPNCENLHKSFLLLRSSDWILNIARHMTLPEHLMQYADQLHDFGQITVHTCLTAQAL